MTYADTLTTPIPSGATRYCITCASDAGTDSIYIDSPTVPSAADYANDYTWANWGPRTIYVSLPGTMLSGSGILDVAEVAA